MKGKNLAGWFFLAQITDVISTYYAIRIFNLEEINPFANLFFQKIGMNEFMLLKIVVVLVLIILYQLSIIKFSKWQLSLEKSLQIGNFGTWVVAASNILMILLVNSYTNI